MIGAALVLIASFLTFYRVAGAEFAPGIGDLSWNAWSSSLSLFPVSALAVLYCLVVGGQVALSRFTDASIPDRLAGIGWTDLRILAGLLASLVFLSYLIREFPGGGIERGIGLYLALIGSIGVFASGLMARAASTTVEDERLASRPGEPTQADWIVIAAGAAILIGSFLTVLGNEGDGGSAWAGGLFPLYTLPALLGAIMAAQVALTSLRDANLPERVLGISWNHIHLAFGIHAALMMLGLLVTRFAFTIEGQSVPGPDRGIGFWIMLLAALALAAGAVMRGRESSTQV